MSLDPSLFISDELQEHPVEVAPGKTIILYFREVAIADLRRYRMAEESADETVRLNAHAHLISKSLADPDGKQAMSYEQAAKLKPRVADKIITKIMEINDFGQREATAKKSSPPEALNGSGTS